MTRAEAKQWLIDNMGIEEPTNAQVSALLNHNRDIEASITEKVTNEVKETFKDYKTPDEVKALNDEITALKDSSAKASRTSKYKENKIADKWHDLADSKLKDSNNFDEDLKKFVKDNPELLVKETTQKQQIRFTNLGDGGKEKDNQDSSSRMNAFIRGENNEE